MSIEYERLRDLTLKQHFSRRILVAHAERFAACIVVQQAEIEVIAEHKMRAFAVRDALKALGVAEDKIELKKPEDMLASGSNAEARRVEVSIK